MQWSIGVTRDFFFQMQQDQGKFERQLQDISKQVNMFIGEQDSQLNFSLSIIYISFCSWLPRMPFCKTSQSRWTILLESEIFNLVKRAGSNISLFFLLISKEALLERQRKMIGATKKIFEEAWEPHQESWISIYFWHRIISLIASTKYTVQNTTWQVLIRWKWKYKKAKLKIQ